MDQRIAFAFALLAAVPLPAAGQQVFDAPLTLHGTPISGVTEVYRLAAPAVPPDEQEPSAAQPRTKGPIRKGALVGGVIGCLTGAVLSKRNNDDAHAFNCLWVAGVGTVAGMVAAVAVTDPAPYTETLGGHGLMQPSPPRPLRGSVDAGGGSW